MPECNCEETLDIILLKAIEAMKLKGIEAGKEAGMKAFDELRNSCLVHRKPKHYCDICDIIFEGEAGKHVNDEHGEEYHSSESMIDFEERHISEVD